MGRKTFTTKQTLFNLREAEVLVGQGESITSACRKSAVAEQAYYRWRKEYGGMGTEQLKCLKELEKESARLKRVVADLSLEKAILAEAARGNFRVPAGCCYWRFRNTSSCRQDDCRQQGKAGAYARTCQRIRSQGA